MVKQDAAYLAIAGYAYKRHNAEHGPWTTLEVLSTFEPDTGPDEKTFSGTTIYRAVARMLEDGNIVRTGTRHTDETGRPEYEYQITPAGEEWATTASGYVMGILIFMPEEARSIVRAQYENNSQI